MRTEALLKNDYDDTATRCAHQSCTSKYWGKLIIPTVGLMPAANDFSYSKILGEKTQKITVEN